MYLRSVLLLLTLTVAGGMVPDAYAQSAFPPTVAAPPERPRLGIRVEQIPFQELAAAGLDHGVRVVAMLPDGPAARAGLVEGDIVVALDGHAVYSVPRLYWLVRQLEPGSTVSLTYVHDGRPTTTDVALLATERSQRERPASVRPRSYLGIGMQRLTQDLRDYFGAPPELGVLVAEVAAEGPAAKAGMAPGDVIIRIDRKDIRGAGDVRRALNYFDPGDEISIVIIRAGDERPLTVTLAEPPGTAGPDSSPRAWPGEGELPPFLQPEFWENEIEGMLDSLEQRWQEWREQRHSESGGAAQRL